jgi:hypothetical protein
MAQKLYTSEEAAKFLGITVDELNAMRERRQVFGIRDGANWKYKQQDVERAADDLKSGGSGVGLPEVEDQETDSVLLSEVELGEPGSASMAGTVIGKPGVMSPIDSDLEIFDADDKRAGSSATSDSDVELIPDLGGSPVDSDVKLVAKDDGPAAPGSDIGGTVELELSDLSLDDDNTDLPFDLGSSLGSSALMDSKVKKSTDAIKPDSEVGSDLTLDVEDASSSIKFDSGISLAEPGGDAPSSSSPSGVDSAIELGGSAFEDDDLVLGSQGGGSDISDSGISLASPADSGLSLEQPLELGDEAEGSGATGELMADDEFLLTPAVEMGEEELDESGSQVIALDTEGDFDDSAATMLGEGGVGMLEEDPLAAGAPALDMSMGTVMPAPTMATMQPVIAREAPYSIFNVISLAACAFFLMLTGMFMFDLMRNIWSWQGPYSFNSSMMDSIISMFE